MADEVVFRRKGESKALGVLVYLLVGPSFAVILGIFTLGVSAALLRHVVNASESVTTAVSLAAGALGVLGGIAWAVHDFRRRASVEIVLRPSSLSHRFGRRLRTWSASEIAGIRLADAGTRVLIDFQDGQRLLLLQEIASPKVALPHLNRLLVPALVDRLEARLAAGDTVVIRDLGIRALPVACHELMRFAVASLAVLSINFADIGVQELSVAIAGLRQCKRGFRGGFVVGADGLRAAAGEPVIPYGRILAVRTDAAGLIVETMRGPLHASPGASHFCELQPFLLRRTSPAIEGAPHLQPAPV